MRSVLASQLPSSESLPAFSRAGQRSYGLETKLFRAVSLRPDSIRDPMEEAVKTVSSSVPSALAVPAHTDWDETDFKTATDVLPVRVPLERLEIGRWKYVGTELSDLELLYELESSSLCIKCSVSGLDGLTPPATFRICDISAADLSLATVIPGSLESMVARLVLETEEPIECSVCSRSEERDEKLSQPGCASADSSSESTVNHTERENGNSSSEHGEVKILRSRIVVMTASVHEAGHLRDILLFLKGGYVGKVSPDTLFLNPRAPQKGQEETDTSLRDIGSDPSIVSDSSSNQITFLESLPVWVRYVPWWVYSRSMRISIQNILFIYSLFSVMWAFWQLYRNVDVIQNVLEPIIAILKVYLASIMEVFDQFLAFITDFWMRFLSPLNILRGLLLAPVLQAMMQLKTIFLPFARVLYSLMQAVWQCLPSTQLFAAFKNVFGFFYVIARILGQNLWLLVSHLMKPFHLIWQGVLNSRIAVASLDLNRLKLSWVVNLVTGSLRAIGNGIAKLCGYTSRRRKLLKVKQNPSQYFSSPRRASAHPRTPVYYSSPLTKED